MATTPQKTTRAYDRVKKFLGADKFFSDKVKDDDLVPVAQNLSAPRAVALVVAALHEDGVDPSKASKTEILRQGFLVLTQGRRVTLPSADAPHDPPAPKRRPKAAPKPSGVSPSRRPKVKAAPKKSASPAPQASRSRAVIGAHDGSFACVNLVLSVLQLEQHLATRPGHSRRVEALNALAQEYQDMVKASRTASQDG